MEAFSQMVERAVDGGFLSACRVGGRGGEGASVSHLLFTDDTLLQEFRGIDHFLMLLVDVV